MAPSLLQLQATTQQVAPAEKTEVLWHIARAFPGILQRAQERWSASPPQSSSITHKAKAWLCKKPEAASPAQHQEVPLVG